MAAAETPAIGSVLPFPIDEIGGGPEESLWSLWTRGHAHASGFRTARGALRTLLIERGAKRLWLPAYICNVTVAGAPPGCEVRFYGHGPGLGLRGLEPKTGDAVLGVDYFGRAPSADLVAMAAEQREVLWIEDRAQALDPGVREWGDVVLYSPRKLIGVADGGLLVSDRPLPVPTAASPPDAAQDWPAHIERLEDPQGARPERWSPAFQAREAAFSAEPAPISALTRGLLRRIAAAPLIARRRANYARLLEHLADYALWPDAAPRFAPLAFPIRVRDIGEAVRRLGAARMFCARHWAELPSPANAFPEAAALSAELLSLPCDHRYGDADMDRLAETVRAVAAPAA